jgi:hypothetical protein
MYASNLCYFDIDILEKMTPAASYMTTLICKNRSLLSSTYVTEEVQEVHCVQQLPIMVSS